jgi:hypothetical protein
MHERGVATGRHLVLAAFWVVDDPEAVADQVVEAIRGIPEPESGGVVTIAEPNVDRQLRAILRTVNLEEAANA